MTFAAGVSDAMSRLARVVEGQPGATIMTRRDDYLHATFKTPLLGFVDDVEFLLVPERHSIEVRSASRVGRSDFGANRKRVERLRKAFEAAS